jgi:protein-S-isoprenylcysteine O-methyltransferase Ste14
MAQPTAGKVLYGLLFIVILPLYLAIWADTVGARVNLPAPALPSVGLALAGVGGVLMIAGIWMLFIHGGGLPMNAYPPPRYVNRGIYRWLAHPIYLGFCLACVGLSLALGSSGGLWLVAPVAALGCVALVWGFERHDLRRRFGGAVQRPWFRLPPATDEKPQWRDFISVAALVFVPWLILYEGVASYIGVIEPVVDSMLWLERSLPVWETSEAFYLLTYPFVVVAPLLARSRRDLRAFAFSGLMATMIVIPFYLTLPVVAPFRPFEPTTYWGEFIRLQQSIDNPATAFPAFHVTWSLLAARLYVRRVPRLRALWWCLAAAMALSSWTTGMHAFLDVIAGIAVFAFTLAPDQVWHWLRRASERMANSWRDWRVGPARLINHGLYGGAAAAIGCLIAGGFLGSVGLDAILVIGLCTIAAAGIWAQAVEGSDRLLRPFGFFGGMLGALGGALLADVVFQLETWHALAAMTVAAPWIQAIGRLRCLVQGCCHGAPAPVRVGIRYHHPQSRVHRLAGLRGQPLHPTPLYSIFGNVLIGFIVFRLAQVEASAGIVVGVYLMLSGLSRFVEEAYRGEPQTPVIAGLKLYQWLSIGCLIAGSAITMLDTPPLSAGDGLGLTIWMGAGLLGILVSAAMGVDLPRSNRRFARLT